jgi:hypothetical protein
MLGLRLQKIFVKIEQHGAIESNLQARADCPYRVDVGARPLSAACLSQISQAEEPLPERIRRTQAEWIRTALGEVGRP